MSFEIIRLIAVVEGESVLVIGWRRSTTLSVKKPSCGGAVLR
jgi:hypothetical protein